MSASVATGMIDLSPEAKRIEQRYRHTMEVPAVTIDGRAAPGILRQVFGGALGYVEKGGLVKVGRRQRGGLSYRERQRRGRRAAGR